MSQKGYEQFFKNARNAADGKPAAKTNSASMKKVTAAVKRKRDKAPFPLSAVFFSIMGIVGAYYCYQNYDKLSQLLGEVEISMFAPARASDTTASSKPEAAKAEKTEPTKPVTAEPTGEELNHLIKLVERKKELDAREEELSRMEAELNKQKEELQKKLTDLEKMRTSISSILEERVKADDQKLETLVQFYSNMKPPQAAKVFETIDEDLAVQILGRMKKKNAADILNLMKPEKAQMFTEKFAGYKRTTASTQKVETSQQNEKTEEEPEMAQKP